MVPLVCRMLSRTPSPDSHEAAKQVELYGPIIVPRDILIGVIENSEVSALLAWRQLSRTCFVAAALALRTRYRECVSPFALNATLFDDVLRRHGAVISGSVALHFFLSTDAWTPGDLDIYVPDHTFDAFCLELVDVGGLRFEPHEREPRRGLPYTLPGKGLIKDVRRFKTPTRRSVDVIRSQRENPLLPLHGFWSTLVKNFICPDGAACAHPRSTMQRRAFVKGSPLSSGDLRAVAKYVRRGFHIHREEWWAEEDEAYAALQRYFGGRSALVVEFRTAVGRTSSPLPVSWTERGWLIQQPFPCAETTGTGDAKGSADGATAIGHMTNTEQE